MREVFKYTKATPCGNHDNIDSEMATMLSCGCSLAYAGCYFITWDGPGLGLVCENEEDAERKAYMMNVAWELARLDGSK